MKIELIGEVNRANQQPKHVQMQMEILSRTSFPRRIEDRNPPGPKTCNTAMKSNRTWNLAES